MPTTTYMGLVLPTVSVTPGPLYATENNTAFTTVDSHDHTTGKGVPITQAAINITADLSLNSFNLTDVNALELVNQSSALGISVVDALSSLNGNPTWNDNSGSSTRILNAAYPFAIGDTFYASSTTAVGRLPIGATGQVLKVAGGLPTWSTTSTTFSVVTKTHANTPYTISATDDVILCDVSGGVLTLSLPTSTGSGKIYTIKKTTADFTVVTIARAGSDTIQDVTASLTSTTLNTQGEELEIIDASSGVWQVLERRIPSVWTAFTPTGNTTTNSTYTGTWRRVGDSLEVQTKIAFSGTPDNVNFQLTILGSLLIDTTKLLGTSSSITLGTASLNHDGTTNQAFIQYESTSTVGFYYINTSTPDNVFFVVTRSAPNTVDNADFFFARYSAPISGWNG